MKRELLAFGVLPHPCCPGHDTYSDDTYNNNRSKRANSRDKKAEHQLARQIAKRKVSRLIEEDDDHT